MPTISKPILLLLLIAGVGVLAVVKWRSASIPPSSAPQNLASPLYQVDIPKGRLDYKVTYESKAKLRLHPLAPQQGPWTQITSSVQGTLQLWVQAIETGHLVRFRFQPQRLSLESNGVAQTSKIRRMKTELEKIGRFEMDGLGNFQHFFLPSQNLAETNALLLALLWPIQKIEHKNQLSWQQAEHFFRTDYMAHYKHQGHQLIKTLSSVKNRSSLIQLEGENLELNATTTYTDGYENIIHQGKTQLAAGRTVISQDHFKTTLHRFLPSVPPKHASLSEPGPLVELHPQAVERKLEQRTLGTTTLEALMAQLQRESGDQKDPKAIISTESFLKLKAYVYLYPDKLRSLTEWLEQRRADDPLFHGILDAYRLVGSPAAQNELHYLAKKSKDRLREMQVILPNLGLVENPIPQTIEVLDQFTHHPQADIAQSSRLALGIAARAFQGDLGETEQKYFKRFSDELLRTEDEREKINLLLVLGNLGSQRQPEMASRYLHSPSPAQKEAAIASLRFSDSPEAESMLLDALGNPDGVIQEAGARALGYRRLSPHNLALQKEALFKTKNERVFSALLSNLAGGIDEFPEVLAILQKSVDLAPTPNTRRLARSLLLGQKN